MAHSRLESLTQAELKNALTYDENSGIFTRKTMKEAGSVGHLGYVRIAIKQKKYLAHRLAWLYVHGEWPPEFIDHIDGNPGNNAISNLRCATPKINSHNRRLKTSAESGLLGVTTRKSGDKTTFRASIRCNGVLHSIGEFKTKELAQAAYLNAKHAMHAGNVHGKPDLPPYVKKRLSATGIKNIYHNRSGYQVKAKINGSNVCLGTYKSLDEAVNVLAAFRSDKQTEIEA